VQGAEPHLLLERVDLDHDAVDLVIEIDPPVLPLGGDASGRLDRFMPLRERVRAEAVLPQPQEEVRLGVELEPLPVAEPVHPDRERARCRDARVELPERAGGRVPRIRGHLPALGHEVLVQAAEGGDRQVDLAAYLEQGRRRAVAVELQGDRADRLQVGGDVLATGAVAPRRAADEDAVLVHERDGRAVDLRLGHVGDGLVGVEPLAHVVAPLLEALEGGHLLERAHRTQVCDLSEALGRSGTDPLGRRARQAQRGIRFLESEQLVHHAVVIRVGELGVVEDEVAVGVVVEQASQLRGPVRRRRRGSREHRAAPPPS